MSPRRAAVARVLANHRLRRMELAFFAFGVSEYGIWVAVLVYAFERGGATRAAVIAVVQLLPAALVAPLAARFADRRGPGRVLVFGYAIQAVILALTSTALLLDVPSAVVYAGAVVSASAITLIRPAQSALVPSLVSGPADLTAANAVGGWVEGLGVLVGPALSGVMIGIDGPGAALALFGAAMAAGALLVVPLGREGGRGDGEEGVADIVDEAGGVLRTLRGQPGLSVLLCLVGVQFIAIGALDVLEVVLAVDVLGMGPAGAGYLGAAYGAGGMVGAAGAFGLIGRHRMTGAIMAAAAVFGATFAALGLWAAVVVALGLLCAVGASHAVMDVATRTVLHRAVAPPFRGRVFGLQEGLSMFGLAVGSIMVPPLVHAGGAEAATATMGGLLVAVTLIGTPAVVGIERGTPVPSAELAALGRSALFEMLAAPVLEDLARALTPHAPAAGEVVVREGDPGRLFYLVGSGELDVSVGGRYMKTLGPGDGFGEIALLRDGTRTATVTARGPVRLFALEREPFLEAVTGSPQAHLAAEELVADRLAAG
jgi:predicted MFS family arabinose efflux permease